MVFAIIHGGGEQEHAVSFDPRTSEETPLAIDWSRDGHAVLLARVNGTVLAHVWRNERGDWEWQVDGTLWVRGRDGVVETEAAAKEAAAAAIATMFGTLACTLGAGASDCVARLETLARAHFAAEDAEIEGEPRSARARRAFWDLSDMAQGLRDRDLDTRGARLRTLALDYVAWRLEDPGHDACLRAGTALRGLLEEKNS